MMITGLDLTLRRISGIENQFNAVFGVENSENKAESTATNGVDSTSNGFANILNGKLDAGSESLPSITGFLPIGQSFTDNNTDFNSIIKKYSDKNGIDEKLVKAVIKAESGFNPNAKSPAGATGLMQLMPATAASLGVSNPFDPEQNIEGGTKYLKGLLDRFEGNKELAVAAYNAGPNAVKKYGGIPPYKETQNYVKKVLSYENEL